MAKKAGVPLLKNWIKRQSSGPKPPVKKRLAKPQKQEAYYDENSPEEGLEDTPVFHAPPQTPMVQAAADQKQEVPVVPEAEKAAVSAVESASVRSTAPVEGASVRSVVPMVTSVPMRPVAPAGKRAAARHTKKGWVSGAIQSALNAVIRLFSGTKSKSKGNAAALAFAGNNRRVGKKGRRNRRILIYAGSALAVMVVVLFVILVPGGAAAPVDAPKTGAAANVSDNLTTENTGAEVSTTDSETFSAIATPSPTPVPTTVAEPTDNPIDMDELLAEYVVKADLYYNEVGYSNNSYNYTENDVYMLAQVIYGEARGENRDGKIAVGNVVMNRVLCSRKFPNTVSGVITQSGQFTGYKSTITPSRECLVAARLVLQYEVWVIPQNIYYYQRAQRDYWYGSFYKKIGDHCFYQTPSLGRSGRIPPALFERTYKYARFGCKPEERVKRIQSMLNTLGYKIEKVDGYFGKGTMEALKKFQKDHGLKDDGVAGPTTVQTLIEEYGVREYYAKFCT